MPLHQDDSFNTKQNQTSMFVIHVVYCTVVSTYFGFRYKFAEFKNVTNKRQNNLGIAVWWWCIINFGEGLHGYSKNVNKDRII